MANATETSQLAAEAHRMFERVAPSSRLRSAPSTSWWRELSEAGWTSLGARRADGTASLETAVAVYHRAGANLIIEGLVTSGYVLSHLVEGLEAGLRESLSQALSESPGILVGDGRLADFDLGAPTEGLCFGTGLPGGQLFRLAQQGENQFELNYCEPGEASPTITPLSELSYDIGHVVIPDSQWKSVPLKISSIELKQLRLEEILVHSAALVGCAERVIKIAIEHCQDRVQFGVPIGGQQAVKHGFADAHVSNEIAWSAVLHAASSPAGDFQTRCEVARFLTVEATLLSARTAAQFMGGMGFTWESDLHFYLKAALDGAQRFGSNGHLAVGLAQRALNKSAPKSASTQSDSSQPDQTEDPGEAEFRSEVRAWASNLPQRLHNATKFGDLLEVDRALGAAGLLGVCWPVASGGRAAPASYETILMEELSEVGISRTEVPSHQGINNFAPALVTHGTDEQRLKHLVPTLSVETIWCQGFSEPEAGSDLANVRMTAEPDDEGFLVNGSKIWTSGAENAHWMYALVRTGDVAERHRSLGFLLIPMDSPGITISPIRQITGETEFSQVFFDGVHVAQDCLVGGISDGWKVAMTLLESERLSGRFRFVKFKGELERLANQVADSTHDGMPQDVASRIGRLFARLEGMGAIAARIDADRAAGRPSKGLPSINKLWWPQVHQELTELGVQLCSELQLDPTFWYRNWLWTRPESIYGGSAQIQRNIIAEHQLGLPRLKQSV